MPWRISQASSPWIPTACFNPSNATASSFSRILSLKLWSNFITANELPIMPTTQCFRCRCILLVVHLLFVKILPSWIQFNHHDLSLVYQFPPTLVVMASCWLFVYQIQARFLVESNPIHNIQWFLLTFIPFLSHNHLINSTWIRKTSNITKAPIQNTVILHYSCCRILLFCLSFGYVIMTSMRRHDFQDGVVSLTAIFLQIRQIHQSSPSL